MAPEPERVIALAGCRLSAGSGPHELYPDPDAAELQDALRAVGRASALVAWDDPEVDWEGFSHVLISSTWDSVDHPAEYLAWAAQVALGTQLINPLQVVAWGLDKSHQQELAAAGVPVITTTWVRPGDSWLVPVAGQFVIKPSVSAGGRQTARYEAGDPRAADHMLQLQQAGQVAMVQPYVSSVDRKGEVDVIFLGGAFSHAVLKKSLLVTGTGVVEKPWEQMSWAGLVSPGAAQLEVADRAMSTVIQKVGCVPAYARVDLVAGGRGELLVIEVEVVDPYLSLAEEPAAAARLAQVILGR